MSASLTQKAADPADFGRDKRGVAARWIAELRMSGDYSHTFEVRGKDIERRYMDERTTPERDQARFNVFWSNVQTLKPAIYATPPKAIVQRRYLDQDPVARAASTILQRAIQTNIDQTGWHESTDMAVLDYLVPGRGVCWARYEPHFDDVGAGAVQDGEAAEDGMAAPMEGVTRHPLDAKSTNDHNSLPDRESALSLSSPPSPDITPDADNQPGMPEDDGLQITNDAEGQSVTYEEVCWDYVNWQDFRHSPARTWAEVRWVARRVMVGLEDGVERFGPMFRDVPMTWRPDGMSEDEPAYQLFTRAVVWEVWDKPSRKIYWICPDYGDAPLDVKDDFLKLTDFFPCPRPLYATLNNASLMPAADFRFYQDQANELDDLTGRIEKLIQVIKAVGVYDAANNGVQRIFDEGVENSLIAIDNWGSFSEKGGFKGAVDFLPLEPMVIALKQLLEVRQQTKEDLYEITGISDIVRGQGMASATATAERLKGQFAQLRLRSRVGDVARFCRDMVRITGELICKHFQPETLLLLSDYQQTMGADPQLAMAAIQLLKNDQARGFRMEIEVDSTVIADQEQEQNARVAFLKMAGEFLAQAVPLAQQVPQLGMLAGQMLLFGIRGFPVGREMETVFETALEQLQQASQQPQQPPVDPEIVKAQQDAQIKQAEMQQRAQADQQKMQLEAAKAEQQMQIEREKMQIERERLMLDADKMAMERDRLRQDADNAEADRQVKVRDIDLKERERSTEQAQGEVTAISDAVAQMQGMLDALTVRTEQAHKMATAPRRVTIERGPDGRAIAARQEMEAAE